MARGRGSFGLSAARGGNTRFRGGFRGRGGRGRGGFSKRNEGVRREEDGTHLAERFERVKLNDEIDEKLGFLAVQEGMAREGWLVNMHPVSVSEFVTAMILKYLAAPHRQQ